MKPQRGQTWRVARATTTDGQLTRNITVTVEAVTRLTCGCDRIETARPGPPDGPLAGAMHLTVNRCRFHAANEQQPDAEPVT